MTSYVENLLKDKRVKINLIYKSKSVVEYNMLVDSKYKLKSFEFNSLKEWVLK